MFLKKFDVAGNLGTLTKSLNEYSKREEKMNVLIVHAHPSEESFNATLTRTAEQVLESLGHSVVVSDLYADGFDPVEGAHHYPQLESRSASAPLAAQREAWARGDLPDDVAREITRLESADCVIFQFPLWWHGMPAILKGWFDRVFVSGGLYTSRMRYDTGYFRGKKALCSLTTGAPEAAFGPGGRGGDIERLMWPIHYSLHYMGYSVLPEFTAFGVQGNGFSYREDGDFGDHLSSIMDRWRLRLSTLSDATPLSFPGWSDWDAEGRALHVPVHS